MEIRPATSADHDAIWAILEPTIRAGETYPLSRDLSREAAFEYWFEPGHVVFVAFDRAQLLGTYYLRANQPGAGAHVANCGYMTAQGSQGHGVGRAMCEHSLAYARSLGFRAMQFNYVVSTNERAVGLWQSCGFAVIGRLPGAFQHPSQGYVDALVMFRSLE